MDSCCAGRLGDYEVWVGATSGAFAIPAGATSLLAYEHCNLHGLWVATAATAVTMGAPQCKLVSSGGLLLSSANTAEANGLVDGAMVTAVACPELVRVFAAWYAALCELLSGLSLSSVSAL